MELLLRLDAVCGEEVEGRGGRPDKPPRLALGRWQSAKAVLIHIPSTSNINLGRLSLWTAGLVSVHPPIFPQI